jgi:hypothetical protein
MVLAEFLDKIHRKVLRVFLLVFTIISTALYCLEIPISSNSRSVTVPCKGEKPDRKSNPLPMV